MHFFWNSIFLKMLKQHLTNRNSRWVGEKKLGNNQTGGCSYFQPLYLKLCFSKKLIWLILYENMSAKNQSEKKFPQALRTSPLRHYQKQDNC